MNRLAQLSAEIFLQLLQYFMALTGAAIKHRWQDIFEPQLLIQLLGRL